MLSPMLKCQICVENLLIHLEICWCLARSGRMVLILVMENLVPWNISWLPPRGHLGHFFLLPMMVGKKRCLQYHMATQNLRLHVSWVFGSKGSWWWIFSNLSTEKNKSTKSLKYLVRLGILSTTSQLVKQEIPLMHKELLVISCYLNLPQSLRRENKLHFRYVLQQLIQVDGIVPAYWFIRTLY